MPREHPVRALLISAYLLVYSGKTVGCYPTFY